MTNKIKLMLIEDDEVIVYLTKKIIKENPHVELGHVFSNGEKAIDFFKEYQNNFDELPDVIFLDISMPVIDGWQFLGEYNKIRDFLPKNISIYITTSSISQSDIIRAKNCNIVNDFIIKPISLENFNEIIEKIG
jgi:CheY-like chemotaxis protein